MRLGLDSGLAIDAVAEELATHIDAADLAAMQGDTVTMINALTNVADRMFKIKPFVPDAFDGLDADSILTLTRWLAGDPVSKIGPDNVGIVEDAFVYRLVWALETIRTRRQANGWTPVDGVIAGAAAACLDTGLPSYQMSMLVRSGLPSRQAALIILNEIDADFFDGTGLRNWLRSEPIATASANPKWPNKDTAKLWARYRHEMLSGKDKAWQTRNERYTLADQIDIKSLPESFGRIVKDKTTGNYWIASVDFKRICPMPEEFSPPTCELNFVRFISDTRLIEVQRIGPTP